MMVVVHPSSTGRRAFFTIPYSINSAGAVAGEYFDGSEHGFVESRGNFTTIDAPGAYITRAYGINAKGTVVGQYWDQTGHGQHGFVYNKGNLATIDVPQSTGGTVVNGINDSGVIVGAYAGPTGINGFIDDNGTITTIDVPGARDTQPEGISDNGVIVGVYDYGGQEHGFVATPTSISSTSASLTMSDLVTGAAVDTSDLLPAAIAVGTSTAQGDSQQTYGASPGVTVPDLTWMYFDSHFHGS
jgi:probable HAF family extracellular repeat protein